MGHVSGRRVADLRRAPARCRVGGSLRQGNRLRISSREAVESVSKGAVGQSTLHRRAFDSGSVVAKGRRPIVAFSSSGPAGVVGSVRCRDVAEQIPYRAGGWCPRTHPDSAQCAVQVQIGHGYCA
jgi:hypothetical protein